MDVSKPTVSVRSPESSRKEAREESSDNSSGMSQSLRESSECSLDSLNQDLPPHQQLVPFSSKGAGKGGGPGEEEETPAQDTPGKSPGVKNVIKNVCTPQAVPLPRKAETNYGMEELVESLPKLKVTTPARIHDESRGAFSMFATPPKSTNSPLIVPVTKPLDTIIPITETLDSHAMNPVDIDPIFNPFDTNSQDGQGDIGQSIKVADDIFSKCSNDNLDSAGKMCGKNVWKNPFDLKAGLEKAGTFLFKAQRSLFAESRVMATENSGLSDSLIANVGSPAAATGVVFKEEQFSPNLSFITTSPSNDSECSFVIPSQNTDCDYLLRRISYDPTTENMMGTSISSSEASTASSSSFRSRVNVPSVIEELRESPEKSPQKPAVSGDAAGGGVEAMEGQTSRPVYNAADYTSPPNSLPAPSSTANPPPILSIASLVTSHTTLGVTTSVDCVSPSKYSKPFKPGVARNPRVHQVQTKPPVSFKPPWTPSGKIRYSTGPYSQIVLSQDRTPIRKIQFGRTTPVSTGKSRIPLPSQEVGTPGGTPRGGVPKAKRPIYRRGTPGGKAAHPRTPGSRVGDSPVSNKKQKCLPKFRLVDKNDQPPNRNTEGGDRHEDSLLLEEKRERLRQLRQAKDRLRAKMAACSPVAGKKRPLSSPVTIPPKRNPLVTMASYTGENSPRMKPANALSLGEKELEAVTKLHTLCNSQQAAKFVTKPRTSGGTRSRPIPKVASRLQWKEELVAQPPGPYSPAKPQSSPARPILSERPPEQLFPYCDQPPSPVVIRRSAKKSNPIAPAKLNFF